MDAADSAFRQHQALAAADAGMPLRGSSRMLQVPLVESTEIPAIAVDGRLEEVYPPTTYREMMRFFDSVPPDWRIADQWNAEVVLWPQYASPLTLADVPRDFVAVHQDGEYVVFVRRRLISGPVPGSLEQPDFSEGSVYLGDFFRVDEDRERFSAYCSEPHRSPVAAAVSP